MSIYNDTEDLRQVCHKTRPAQWVDESIHGPLGNKSSNRVCDRCMVKKVKCNLQRPACFRCLEENHPCVYSSTKRKPGPAKGSIRKRSRVEHPTTDELIDASQQVSISIETIPSLSFPLLQRISEPSPSSSVDKAPLLSQVGSIPSPVDPQLNSSQERQLLQDFFAYISPSIPVFRKEVFLQRYELGLVNGDLLLTILVVSAKIQGFTSIWTTSNLPRCLEYLLATEATEDEGLSTSELLESFQQACLLAYFEFHQYPGKKSWSRIGNLTRRAYRCGLNQLDNREQCPLFDLKAMSHDEIEEWRYVWWCIYCLDSYCNITAATPFVIETDSIRTALVKTAHHGDNQLIFLPPETNLLWKTIKDVTSQSADISFNMHIVTSTVLREASTLSRLWRQNPSDRVRARIAAVEDHLAAVRLALPVYFLNVARNVFQNETEAEHHARLISLLHLNAARMVIALPVHLKVDHKIWQDRWQQTLEYCEDTVFVVKQWNRQFCSSVDPAICFIISAALVVIHLHSKADTSTDTELQARLARYKDLLLLFLEQFASIWHLPNFLIVSFNKFCEILPESLTSSDVEQILGRMQGALHQSWMRYLSLTPQLLTPPSMQDFDSTIFSEWDFNDWESWATAAIMSTE